MTYRGAERRRPGRGQGDRTWTWGDQQRFEDGIQDRLRELEDKVDRLTGRVTAIAAIGAVLALVVAPLTVAVLSHGLGL